MQNATRRFKVLPVFKFCKICKRVIKDKELCRECQLRLDDDVKWAQERMADILFDKLFISGTGDDENRYGNG